MKESRKMTTSDERVNTRLHDEGGNRTTRNAAATRSRIVAAAQEAFATNGYGAVSIRAVAARAGINAALVIRYFGSKETLFEAAVESMELGSGIWGNAGPGFGTETAARLLAALDSAGPVQMLLLACADPEARGRCLELIEACLVAPLLVALGTQATRARADRIIATAAGFFIGQTLLQLPTQAGPADCATTVWFSRALQLAHDS